MNGLQQPPLAVGGRRGSHLEIGGGHRHAPPGGAADIPLHNQERLVYVLQRGSVLPYGHRQGGKAHRAAVEFVNHRFQQALVHLVQAIVVNLNHGQGVVRQLLRNHAVAAHLGVIPHPAQQGIGHAGRAAGAQRDLQGALRVHGHVQQPRGPFDNGAQLLPRIIIQSVHQAEAGTQRAGQHPGAGGGTHQGELGQVELDGAGVRPLVDNNIQPEILHGRVQILLNGRVQAVDLINKQNIPLFQIGQHAGQVSRLFNLGAGSRMNAAADGIRDNIGKRRLPQARGTAQQDVIQHVVALSGGFHHQHQAVLNLLLPAELAESGWSEGQIKSGGGGLRGACVKGLSHAQD